MKFIKAGLFFSLFAIYANTLFAQDKKVIEEVIAIVGDEIITKAELEIKLAAIVSQGAKITDNTRCEVMEDILFSKALLNQAKVDSIEVSDGQLESEMDRRLRYFISQIGSERGLEEYYKKPISKIKEEMRESLKDQLLIQGMQSKISSGLIATPSEVQEYYNRIPTDSLPLINAEVEVAEIVAFAPTSQTSIDEVKEKLRNYKKRILEGEKFSTLAVLYSEDKGSAIKGGEIGFVGRAEVEPEFSAAAFALKAGQVSPIVKTKFGYHIIELIERRGSKINVRHILLKPKLDPESMLKAKTKLEGILAEIKSDSLNFNEAAKKYSEDEETKKSGGILVNPYTSSSMYPMDELDPSLFFVVDKMEEGEISVPVEIQDPRSQPGYRLILLSRRSKPHKANLKQDYQKIKNATLAEKEQELIKIWMEGIVEKTYVKIDENYQQGCEFELNWLKK